MNKVCTYVKAILLPLLVGGIVGLIISGFMHYNSLEKPFLAPPGIVFPIVWTILYILMGISYGRLKSQNLTNAEIDLIYYAQLFVNALWPIFFFVLDWRLFSFIWIVLLLVLVAIMIKAFYKQDKIAGLLQIPYFLWVIFATYLTLSFYLLNR